MEKQPIFVKSEEREILENTLRSIAVGELATYKALAASIGVGDSDDFRKGILQRARMGLVADGYTFRADPNVGLRRLSDAQCVEESGRARKRVHRATRREITRLRAVEFDALPGAAQVMYNGQVALWGVLAGITQTKAVKRLTAKIEQAKVALDESQAIASLLGKKA